MLVVFVALFVASSTVALFFYVRFLEAHEALVGIYANSYPDEMVAPRDYGPMRSIQIAAGSVLGQEFTRRWRPCPDRRVAAQVYRRRQLDTARAVGGLDFKHACLWLSQGLSVRRSCWGDGVFIAFAPRGGDLINAELRVFGPECSVEGDSFCPDCTDVDAVDWFPVDGEEASRAAE